MFIGRVALKVSQVGVRLLDYANALEFGLRLRMLRRRTLVAVVLLQRVKLVGVLGRRHG